MTTLYILWMVCLPMFLHVCAAKETPLIAGSKKKKIKNHKKRKDNTSKEKLKEIRSLRLD